jgi:hypothetical protein
MHPFEDQYIQIIQSLYTYFNYNVPPPSLIKPLQSNLLNYTFIKPNEDDILKEIVEIYTIFNDEQQNNESLNDQLLLPLKPYSGDIDVLIFSDCNHSALTKSINSYNVEENQQDKEDFKNLKILPLIYSSLYPFFTKLSTDEDIINWNWKSYTIIYSNVSKWTYNVLTIPIVDFVQQLLRSLLHEYTTNGQLIYFPHDISHGTSKLTSLWTRLLTFNTNYKSESEDDEQSDTNAIRYNDLSIISQQDNPEHIQMLDESFSWADCQHNWHLVRQNEQCRK